MDVVSLLLLSVSCTSVAGSGDRVSTRDEIQAGDTDEDGRVLHELVR
jgi:hypothetical protein